MPATPAFSTVDIAPHLGSLAHLSATLPHPAGEISVHYERRGDALAADVTLPAGLSGSFRWEGKTVALHEGSQHLVF